MEEIWVKLVLRHIKFKQIGVIKIDKKNISENDILELAINSGAEDCSSENIYHEIIHGKRKFL